MSEPGKPHLTWRTFARYREYSSDLKEGGAGDALATYHSKSGEALFAFHPEGFVIDPQGEARLIAYISIADTGYHDGVQLFSDKTVLRQGGSLVEDLSIQLADGETLRLPLNKRDDRMSERLTIAGLLQRIVTKARLGV